MKSILTRTKAELKSLAHTITESKKQFKEDQRNGILCWKSEAWRTLGKAQHEYRHRHIARCMLRGRTLIQIENKERCANEKGRCYSCNHPDLKYVEKLLKEYRDEALRCNQSGSVEEPTSSSSGACVSRVGDEVPASMAFVEQNASIPENPGSPGAMETALRAKPFFRTVGDVLRARFG